MKFEITLTKKHLLDFLKYTIDKVNSHQSIQTKNMFFSFGYWFLLVLFVVSIANIYHNQECWQFRHLNYAVIAFAIWFITANVWNRWYQKSFAAASFDDKGCCIGTHEIEISPEKITSRQQHGYSELDWDAVLSLKKHQQDLYLYIDSSQALIIPLDQVDSRVESLICEYTGKKVNDGDNDFIF